MCKLSFYALIGGIRGQVLPVTAGFSIRHLGASEFLAQRNHSAVILAGRRQCETKHSKQSRIGDGQPGTFRFELQDFKLHISFLFQMRFQLRKQLFFSLGIAKFKQCTLALYFIKAGIPSGAET